MAVRITTPLTRLHPIALYRAPGVLDLTGVLFVLWYRAR